MKRYFLVTGKALILTIILSLLVHSFAFSQLKEPVKWTFNSKRINDTITELQFSAKIDFTWHMYSQEVPPDGPRATLFTFIKPSGYQLIGKVKEPKPKVEFDEMFEKNVKFFEGQASFTQQIKIQSNKPVKITGEVEFQACDNKNCIFDTKPFSFDLDGSRSYKPQTAVNVVVQNQAKIADTVTTAMSDSVTAPTKIIKIQPVDNGKTPLWLFFFIAFLAGLIAIVTPCVFPMIPMTVSYFMKSGSNGKVQATIYGLAIIAIYTLFGTVVAVLFGAEFSNWISTHWIPNVLFFLIFVIFAASFFGYFEITMPNWLVSKSVSAEDKGGTAGTIFMALTLVLVSFSCTGPIVGTILVQSVGGKILMPIVGMLGFSLAFAIPFTLFALFPQWLNKLPKSGGWLNSVKVVLGFIELAFALKFLNVPDQTYHWGILDREIYLGFWIVIFTMMGFYLLGKIKFPHDSDYPVVKSFPRLILIIATFTFVIYLIPGLWGAPLKGISGWLPPMETQDFDVTSIVRDNARGGSENKGNLAESPKYSNTALKIPLGLKGYFDYDEALKASKVLNKPVFVDFTGFGCTNCREMENRVWSDPQVLKRLRENFVLAELYVDDKVTEMPEKEWYTNKSGSLVKLLSKKNAEIQIEKFGANAQPFYVILDGDGNLLVQPHAYDLDIQSYIKFLDDGVAAYNKSYSIK
jgi:thiol:disulfide interchange protein